MPRTSIELLIGALEDAYRSGRFHALLENLRDVRDEEWTARPAEHDVEVFGEPSDLSIADLVKHVGEAKQMWANHAFGDGSLDWASAAPPSMEREAMLAWLDDAERGFVAGVTALEDDSELEVERQAHWGRPMRTAEIISIVINHDLYHSGEINRQRTLIRGSSGWELTE